MSTLTEINDKMAAADPSISELRNHALQVIAGRPLIKSIVELYNKTGEVANRAHVMFEMNDPAALTLASAGLLTTREMLGLIIEHMETNNG